jgi:hypothetical protein
LRLLFLHAHRQAGALAGELPKECDEFRFLRAACLANLKGSVGLILTNQSLTNEGYYSTRLIYAAIHTSPPLLSLSTHPFFLVLP